MFSSQVLDTIGQYRCVAAFLSGHTHVYSYSEDTNGIHHIVFPGIIEATPGTNAFATMDIYADHCDVRGYGQMPSFTFRYPACQGDQEDCAADSRREEVTIGKSASKEVLVKS